MHGIGMPSRGWFRLSHVVLLSYWRAQCVGPGELSFFPLLLLLFPPPLLCLHFVSFSMPVFHSLLRRGGILESMTFEVHFQIRVAVILVICRYGAISGGKRALLASRAMHEAS